MDKFEKQKYIMSLMNNKTIREEFKEQLSSPAGASDISIVEKKYNDLLKKSKYLESIYKFQSSIIHNLSSALIVIDLDGNITFSNRAAQELLKYAHDELNSISLKELFADESEGANFTELLTVYGKKFKNKECLFVDKEGKQVQIGLTTANFVDDYNGYEGRIILFKDLTEVKQLKKQIERMDRLALLGELSAGIAHEIRNPLAGIKAAAQILDESIGEDTNNKILLQRIIKEIDKSNKLLKEFFKFARPSRPKLEFVDIETLIDGLFLLINPRIKKQNVVTEINYEENLPKAYIDETQIEQVMLNILLNALDAMPEGGKLSISVNKHELEPFEANEIIEKTFNQQTLYYVSIMISDTGVGIKQDHLDKIFDPFFTTKADGLGLGLSICSRLLEENLGKIDASSDESGTTFTLMLPCFYHN